MASLFRGRSYLFGAMRNIPEKDRSLLQNSFEICDLQTETDLLSQDGSRKWAFRLHDGPLIESVYIPEAGASIPALDCFLCLTIFLSLARAVCACGSDRGTLCVSSQAGCSVAAVSAPRGQWAPGAIGPPPKLLHSFRLRGGA